MSDLFADVYVDKSTWGDGPWTTEPDKLQFVTETGLAGLVVRNPGGALCGYVGIDRAHPLYGIGYNEESPILSVALERRKELPVGEQPAFSLLVACVFGGGVTPRPDTVFTVHGGLTFSGACAEPTEETWKRWRSSMLGRRGEAARFPRGDMAEAWRERATQVDDYAAWAAYVQRRSICHVGAEPLWWFGFDCSHCDDYAPKFDVDMRGLGPEACQRGVYRDLAYVMAEIESLARQLTLLEPGV